MSPVLLLLLLLHATEADPLGPAREAFARGDYATAETLAVAEARPPVEGAALYLAGLARFRSHHAAEALVAIEAAGAATDAPPRAEWQFNRAACLYDLGRFAEAEQAFVEAAEGSPALAALSLANAGFAALDLGDPDRATALAARGRALGDPAAAPLLDDLDAQLAHDRGRRLVTASGEALRGGDRVEARRLARAALEAPLAPADAAGARALVDATSPGMSARAPGWDLTLRLGAGYDSNVLQSGLRSGQDYVPIATGEAKSAALLGTIAVGHRTRLAERIRLETGYALEQAAYLATAAEDDSLQLHSLGVAAEWAATDSFRTGLGALGQYTFTGLSAFRGLQGSAAGLGWAALDETDATTTRLDLGWAWKWGGANEFEYLTGHRLDLALSQQLRIKSAAVELGYRYRDERIGTLTTSSTANLQLAGCVMVACTVAYREPFAYQSHAILLGARTPLGAALHLGALTGFEWRTYRGDNVLTAELTGGMMGGGGTVEAYRQQRQDERFFAVVFASWRLTPWFSLAARYDLIVSSSTIQSTYDDRNYTKQVGTLESVFSLP